MAESHIRPAKPDDLWHILQWRNAPRVRQAMLTQHEISPTEHQAWFTHKQADPLFRQMVSEDGGTPVCVQAFFDIQPGQSAWWAFYFTDAVPNDMASMLRIWKGVELAGLVYAFDVLKLETLYCEVLLSNSAVRQWHKRFGFLPCDPKISANTEHYELEVLRLDRAAYEQLRTSRNGREMTTLSLEHHPFDTPNFFKEQSS